MAEKEENFIPRSKPKFRIKPEAIHTARRKLQSLSKDGSIDLNGDEREALLRLIAETKREYYPTEMAVSRYEYHLNQITKVDQDSDQWDKFFRKIQEFEEKYCV